MTFSIIAVYMFRVALFLGGAWVGHAITKADWDAEKVHQASELVKAVESARADEEKLREAVETSAERARDELVQLRIDRAAGDVESQRLRQRIATIVATKRPTPAGGGEATGDPIGVLADVLGRADERAGILADYADRARVAGLACQRSYEALSNENQ